MAEIWQLPGTSAANLTLSELQGLAARQQAAMETQQQALVARETRLKYLQQQEARHRQLASETVRLQRIREKVEAQELKLKKLRAVHGQVEQYKVSNGNLTDSELEAVKALFNEKEKELAVASSRVDVLNQQLKEAKAMVLITSNGNTIKGDPHALALELDRLRQELLHRNKLNEQQSSHLAAQRQLLKQRKDEVSKMDARIHELQQRLKKRRSQHQLQPNTKVSSDKGGEQSLPVSRLQNQGRKPGAPNVAAVEPYIQYAPKDVVKDDLYSKTSFQKQDPKYQTLPPNTKFIPSGDESSKPGGVAGNQEVNNNNNNNNKGGSGVSGVKHVEYKIPALISSHFNAHRGQSGSAANRTSTDSAGAGGPDSVKPSTQPSTQGPGSSSTPQQLVNKLPKGPRPFVNTFGKSGLLPKWPPEPKKDEDAAPKPASHQVPPHHPQINIFDEERQAGSGQSSPASSEGSGPLVKQGSGVFVHPLAASSQPNPPVASVNQTGSGPPHENKFLGQPLDFRGVAGLQEPKPPSNTPQGSSLESPRVVNLNQPAAVKPGDGNGDDTDSSRLSGNDSVNLGMPQATSTPQGAEDKTGSTVHLNQRPAPTYRYASKNVIANTYMGRLGSSALARYQQLNKQLYSTIDSTQGNNAQTQEPSQKPTNKKTLADELRAAFNNQKQEPSENLPMDGQGGMTQFGLVGSPNYPDIASDKGSFKPNTPKHIRRRHSDSDSEDTGKAFNRGDRPRQQNSQSEEGSTINNNATQNSTTTDAEAKPSSQRRRTNSESGGNNKNTSSSSNQEKQGGTDSKTTVVLRQKKTILKGDNRRKSNNRVSFDPLALLLDASLEGELDLVSRTAKEVVDVSAPNDEGITALHNAICAGHYDIVKFLIEFGADVNSPDSDGWTPLHCAASCNNLPMVRFLVEHGACIFATTISDNETAAEKCEEDEDGYDGCSDYLYSTQEKLGIANDGVVYAVFDYYACNQDEVSFRINTKMTVLRKGDDVEKEWWWARLTPNKEGYIPRNLLGLHPRVIPSDYSPHETSDC